MTNAPTWNEVRAILGTIKGGQAWLGSAPLSRIKSDDGKWFWVVRENECIVKIERTD